MTLNSTENRIGLVRVIDDAELKPLAATTNGEAMSLIDKPDPTVTVVCSEFDHAGACKPSDMLSHFPPRSAERKFGKES